MELAIPYVLIFFSAQFAQEVKQYDQYLEFQFSFEHMGLLKESQSK